MECVEKLIKKDMMDPISGDKLIDKDIIPLQRVSEGVKIWKKKKNHKYEGNIVYWYNNIIINYNNTIITIIIICYNPLS